MTTNKQIKVTSVKNTRTYKIFSNLAAAEEWMDQIGGTFKVEKCPNVTYFPGTFFKVIELSTAEVYVLVIRTNSEFKLVCLNEDENTTNWYKFEGDFPSYERIDTVIQSFNFSINWKWSVISQVDAFQIVRNDSDKI